MTCYKCYCKYVNIIHCIDDWVGLSIGNVCVYTCENLSIHSLPLYIYRDILVCHIVKQQIKLFNLICIHSHKMWSKWKLIKYGIYFDLNSLVAWNTIHPIESNSIRADVIEGKHVWTVHHSNKTSIPKLTHSV